MGKSQKPHHGRQWQRWARTHHNGLTNLPFCWETPNSCVYFAVILDVPFKDPKKGGRPELLLKVAALWEKRTPHKVEFSKEDSIVPFTIVNL